MSDEEKDPPEEEDAVSIAPSEPRAKIESTPSLNSSERAPSLNASERRASLTKALKNAGIGGLLYAAVQFIGGFLASTPLAALVAQAVVAEWVGGRIGIAWSNPHAKTQTTKDLTKRFFKGTVIGVGPAIVLVEVLHAAHHAEFHPASVSIASLVTGLMGSLLAAARDQLLLSGVILVVLVNVQARAPKILACAAMSAAHAYSFSTGGSYVETIAAFALGLIAGTLWVFEKGAFLAVGMNAGWLFATGTLFHGVFVDVAADASTFAGGDAGMASGTAAAIVLFATALAAMIVVLRPQRAIGAGSNDPSNATDPRNAPKH